MSRIGPTLCFETSGNIRVVFRLEQMNMLCCVQAGTDEHVLCCFQAGTDENVVLHSGYMCPYSWRSYTAKQVCLIT